MLARMQLADALFGIGAFDGLDQAHEQCFALRLALLDVLGEALQQFQQLL